MGEELELEPELELVVEVDDEGVSQEWVYTVLPQALTYWEGVDLEDPLSGKKLVRCLVISRLSEHSDSLADLLFNNCVPPTFLEQGVSEEVCDTVPRLALVNSIVDKVYTCLTQSVVALGIRVVH